MPRLKNNTRLPCEMVVRVTEVTTHTLLLRLSRCRIEMLNIRSRAFNLFVPDTTTMRPSPARLLNILVPVKRYAMLNKYMSALCWYSLVSAVDYAVKIRVNPQQTGIDTNVKHSMVSPRLYFFEWFHGLKGVCRIPLTKLVCVLIFLTMTGRCQFMIPASRGGSRPTSGAPEGWG